MFRKGYNASTYQAVRGMIQPGDVIAFGGRGAFSTAIKCLTRSPVSHVGIIVQTLLMDTHWDGRLAPEHFNELVESTSKDGFMGVVKSLASKRIESYDGEVWWLPLSKAARESISKNRAAYLLWMTRQIGKKYDMAQAIKSAMDALDNVPVLSGLTHADEDFGRFFCSELAAAGLEVGGVIKKINASEVTPADLCMFRIYANYYVQLKGKKKPIKGFNYVSPEGWGV